MTAAEDSRSERQRAPDGATTEHILLGSESLNPDPKVASRTLRERVHLRNALLRMNTELALYEEGFLKVVTQDRGQRGGAFHLDLHYLDPVPTIDAVIAKRTRRPGNRLHRPRGRRRGAAPRGACAPRCRPSSSAPWSQRAPRSPSPSTAATRESNSLRCTGARPCSACVASLGSIKRFRGFVPDLSRAIEEAAERIGDDTSAYLRGEMREHYRLRGTGVLSDEACAASTGRILSQFDVPL